MDEDDYDDDDEFADFNARSSLIQELNSFKFEFLNKI